MVGGFAAWFRKSTCLETRNIDGVNALWGGCTAALPFMLGKQVQVAKESIH